MINDIKLGKNWFEATQVARPLLLPFPAVEGGRKGGEEGREGQAGEHGNIM